MGEQNFECSECHSLTVNSDGEILSVTKDRHVNGEVTMDFLSGMAITNLRCTGTCHDRYHANRFWGND